MLKDRRIGKFQIGLDVINDAPEVVTLIMGQTIVLRAEHVLSLSSIEYEAICEHFDELAGGEIVPEYDVVYDGETGAITWAKQE